MIIDCLADLHGYEPKLPGGDLLILVGDYTASDQLKQWAKFFDWVKKQPYQKKVLIAGNHDGFFESGFPKNQKEADTLQEVRSFLLEQRQMEAPDFEYLCDSGTEYEGLKIWGTPWTPWFKGVHPKCKAFMKSESYLEKKFNLIPKGLDILICHGPPYGMMDKVKLENDIYKRVGSSSLANHIRKVQPKIFLCGHIHEQHGLYFNQDTHITYINCSYVNEYYEPKNGYTRFSIEKRL